MPLINQLRHITAIILFASALIPAAHAKPITVTTLDSMEFGTLTPSNGTCSMASNGKLTGIGGQNCTGTGQAARFQIRGDKNASIFITLSGSSTGGLTLNPILDDSPSQILNGGKVTIKVIAELIFSNITVSGNLGLSYTLSANYE